MMVLITYDVNTEDAAGKKRLRKIAKKCTNYGQRVQNSVFECLIDAAQYVEIKNELLNAYKEDRDSLRFYRLGNNYSDKVESFGQGVEFEQGDILILQRCELEIDMKLPGGSHQELFEQVLFFIDCRSVKER